MEEPDLSSVRGMVRLTDSRSPRNFPTGGNDNLHCTDKISGVFLSAGYFEVS